MRDDDNEYDVQYEDGTIFTIKAKDVKKRSIADDKTAKKATPSRSRCVRNPNGIHAPSHVRYVLLFIPQRTCAIKLSNRIFKPCSCILPSALKICLIMEGAAASYDQI